jgi:RNA polymerase sigma-70 factor (ECF subfamily)
LGMVKNQEDAMDIAQDAFVKVHRYIGNFQGTSSFYTWLYRIVVNLCIDHLRRSGKRIKMDFDEKAGYQYDAVTDNAMIGTRLDTNPAKVLGRKELAERIQAAVDELPPYHRAVIIMREIEGLSYSEMAKTLKVSKGTIMSRLHHARQKLKRSLDPYLKGTITVEE